MSAYLQETKTMAELVASVNELGHRLSEKTGRRFEDYVAPEFTTEWVITYRSDPHNKLLDVMAEMLRLPYGDRLGMMLARDEGNARLKRMFDGYYAAVARCVEVNNISGVREWREALEADTPEADALDDLVSLYHVYCSFRQMDAEKKSAASSESETTGGTNG